MGDQVAYIGPIGAGAIVKLVHNCTSAVMGVALAEDRSSCGKRCARGRPAASGLFDRLGRFLSSQHDPADFALRLLHRDVGLAVGLGREVGADAARQYGL